jgi:hypothetical protein
MKAKEKDIQTVSGKETVVALESDSNESGEKAKNGESAPVNNSDGPKETAAMTPGGSNVAASRSEGTEEAAYQATASAMKAELDKQEKVAVFVPLENGEPRGTQLPVEINGHKMYVPKGVPGVEVPKSVAEIIWQSLGVYDEASASVRSQNDPSRPLRTDLQNEADQRTIGA